MTWLKIPGYCKGVNPGQPVRCPEEDAAEPLAIQGWPNEFWWRWRVLWTERLVQALTNNRVWTKASAFTDIEHGPDAPGQRKTLM